MALLPNNQPNPPEKQPRKRPVIQTVGEFFNQVSTRYDESIATGCPVYGEMMANLLDYIFIDENEPIRILELGCGTGNLSELVAERFPNAHLTLVDISREMLDLAERKVRFSAKDYTLIQSDFNQLVLGTNQFDLVVSSIALHHLLDAQKKPLYDKIFQWLKPGGKLRIADEALAKPAVAQEFNLERWAMWSKAKGASEETIAMWTEHGELYDHYAPLTSHFDWLREAGFTQIDCYWRTVLWAVFGGEKAV